MLVLNDRGDTMGEFIPQQQQGLCANHKGGALRGKNRGQTMVCKRGRSEADKREGWGNMGGCGGRALFMLHFPFSATPSTTNEFWTCNV